MTPITSSPARFSPSFQIRGAGGDSAASLRLDRINSRDVFAAARRVLFRHMEWCPEGPDPLGVVLSGRGRVVFELPVLLPDEQFVPLEFLLTRHQRGGASRRSRLQVPRPVR